MLSAHLYIRHLKEELTCMISEIQVPQQKRGSCKRLQKSVLTLCVLGEPDTLHCRFPLGPVLDKLIKMPQGKKSLILGDLGLNSWTILPIYIKTGTPVS